MFKKHSKLVIFTSLFTILPILIGLLLWTKLPAKIAIHFSTNGADGWSSKTFVVFVVPFILLATHILSIFLTSLDPKCKDLKTIPLYFTFLCVPIISNITMIFLYLNALNITFNTVILSNALAGLVLIILSYIMPQLSPNHVIGIKLPWTINNETVWYKTHKLASILWTVGGIILLINIFIKNIIITSIIFIILILVPIIYSYILSKKEN